MQFHYALVDDLISREEFERRIEAKMQECGDLIDDVTAAMLIVGELGRQHVKISGLSGPSTLFSFFGKVIQTSPPREFTRKDGEKGWVSHLILGDETGQVRAVLWDEKAAAAVEIETGDVLEVIGKRTSNQGTDIAVLALRKAPCEIDCGISVHPRFVPPERKDLTLRVLHLARPRIITRRDGSPSELADGCVTDGSTVARIVSWEPSLFDAILPGMTIRVRGGLVKMRNNGVEYVIDERSEVAVEGCEIPFRFSRLDEVCTGGSWSVEGDITSVQQVRAFTSRDGRSGHVRNLVLSEGLHHARVVLWGDQALIPLVVGDRVSLYNAVHRTGRTGDPELHIGSGGFIAVHPTGRPEEIVMEGTAIVTREGTFLDNGTRRFLVSGELPHGYEIRVQGTRSGDRITPVSFEVLQKEKGELCSLLAELAGTL